VVKKDGLQIKNGLELWAQISEISNNAHTDLFGFSVRCLSAKAWEDRAIVFRQIEHIGEKS